MKGTLYSRYIDLLSRSGIEKSPRHFTRLLIYWGVGLGIVFAIGFSFFSVPFLLSFVIVALCVPGLAIGNLALAQDKKARLVEEVLPDALQLMGSNLRAGYTVDRALIMSARPEFGVLSKELDRVGRDITTGMPISKALLQMVDRVRSKKLERVIELIVSGLRSGGELANLLFQSAEDLRNQAIVERKIAANVGSYVIFIFVALGVAAPVLFALSSFLSDVIGSILSEIDIPSGQGFGFELGEVTLSAEFLIQFVIVYLSVQSILGSFVIGQISTGRARDGIKYIIPLILIGVFLFLIIRYSVGIFLGGTFGF